jgi:hypothetical protein
MDSTGISYRGKTTKLAKLRAVEIGKVAGHSRVCAPINYPKKPAKLVIISAASGNAYESDYKLAREVINGTPQQKRAILLHNRGFDAKETPAKKKGPKRILIEDYIDIEE